MKFCFELCLLASTSSLWMLPTAQSISVDDAGVLDFTIATAGHGVTRFVETFKDTIVTSDSPSDSSTTSCYVASRNIDDGSLVWRRNVCSVPSEEDQHHSIATSGDFFYTMDNTGIVRAWTMKEGKLVWDAQVAPSTSPPRIFAISRSDKTYVVATSDGDVTVLEAETGKSVDTISAVAALAQTSYKLKSGEVAQWLTILPNDSNSGASFRGILAFVKDGITTGSRMLVAEVEIGDDRFVSTKALSHVKPSVVASSVQVQKVGREWQAVAVTSESTSAVHFSLDNSKTSTEIEASTWNPSWTSVVSVKPTPVSSVVSLQGMDSESRETMALYRFDDKTGSGWEKLHGLQEDAQDAAFDAIAYCPDAELVVAINTEGLNVYRHDSLSEQADPGANRHGRLSPLSTMTVKGDMSIPDGDSVISFSVIGCTADKVTTLLNTVAGSTTQLSFTISAQEVNSKVGWTAEEGLASVSSAVILDASHLGVDDMMEEKDIVMGKLSLPSRLYSQWSGILSMVTGVVSGSSNRRDHLFGFVKVAAVLSQKSHRMWGIDTSGESRGSVSWSLDLPKTADWHTMVHGTTNSAKSVNGINGGTHSREILTLSASPSSVEWKCIDGTNGAVHAQETVEIASPVVQVMPIYGGAGACRQASLLLHEDLTLTVIPGDQDTVTLVEKQLKNTPNGMFTHIVDKAASKLESFQVAEDSGKLVSRQVGRTSFAGERIVKMAYPNRDEVVQSMSTILGDDSLLLKYINPHLAVVVTVSEDDTLSTSNIASSIENNQGIQKRKPAGAGDVVIAETTNDDSVPNMFVNLVDTVSGRLLHRSSHSGVDGSRDMTALVSENWIIYTFVNAKTRRTELGVLTLHEGMIDSKGMTLFSSPEQATTFSSLDARKSKPVVLAKTYTFPKAVTALGSTATRGGISTRKILIASADGKITAVDRHMLETRRPVGEVKDAEKKEGLFPYKELIPEVSMMALTYNQTVESVTSVVASPTSLESQSLVFAFGGPDLFFTRMSPSKGFDLLPDSFSRELVSIVSIGLVVVLFTVQRIGSKKLLKQGWL